MGAKTGIEWTDATWNPIIGCTRVSEGCRNCYAEKIATRFGNGKPTVYSGLTRIVNGHPQWTGQIKETQQLLQPFSWKKPRRVFVNSMSDLFHENVTDELRDRIFAVMALCPQHTFQVLTKRPERMLAYCIEAQPQVWDRMTRTPHRTVNRVGGKPLGWPLPNVWLGVSVEDQAAADKRIPLLLQTPAAVRFISAEPLLGPVNLHNYVSHPASLAGSAIARAAYLSVAGRTLLDWVICGGESGPGARPMHPDWARGLRDQCAAAGVPFFFKQWGEWRPTKIQHIHSQDKAAQLIAMTTICSSPRSEVGKVSHWAYPSVVAEGNWGLVERMESVGKKAAGALLDGREWKQFPETQG